MTDACAGRLCCHSAPARGVRSSPLERETGIEPAPSAWKAEVLPLNYSRIVRTPVRSAFRGPRRQPPHLPESGARKVAEGMDDSDCVLILRAVSLRDTFSNALRRCCRTFTFLRWFEPTSRNAKLRCSWWREVDSNHRRREPADLQSAPVGRLGIPPNEPRILYRIDAHVNGGPTSKRTRLPCGPSPTPVTESVTWPERAVTWPCAVTPRADQSRRPPGSLRAASRVFTAAIFSGGSAPPLQRRSVTWKEPSATAPKARSPGSCAAVPPRPAARSPSTRRYRSSRCCSRSPY